jgi:amino acid transporter
MAKDDSTKKTTSLFMGTLKRELTLLPLFGLIYFTICGGSFGIEPLVGWSGPGMALLLMVIMPFFFSIPNMLMVREMTSMMPVEGGTYHWVKQAFDPFTGFMSGWMNWVFSWVDVSIYPVLAAYYLGLLYVTLFPLVVIILVIYSQVSEDGVKSIGWALIAMVIGTILCSPIKNMLNATSRISIRLMLRMERINCLIKKNMYPC